MIQRTLNFFLFILLIVGNILICKAQNQSWQSIPLINGTDYGILNRSQIVEWNDSLFFAYDHVAHSWNNLAKFNGKHFQIITNDRGKPGIKIVGGLSVKHNKIYFINEKPDIQSLKMNLAVYNRHDSSISVFDNPDNGYGLEPNPIHFKNEIYYLYRTEDGSKFPVKLTESGPELLQTPNNFSISSFYIFEDCIFFQGGYTDPSGISYPILKFDGQNFSVIKANSAYTLNYNIIECKGEYFTVAKEPFGEERIARITDTAINIIQILPNGSYVYSPLTSYNDKIWFTFIETIGMEKKIHLATFENDSTKIQISDFKKRMEFESIVFKGDLYFKCSGYPNYLISTLIRIKQGVINEIPLPQNIGDAWWDSFSPLFENNGTLYTYVKWHNEQNEQQNYNLSLTGDTFNIIPSPLHTINPLMQAPIFKGAPMAYYWYYGPAPEYRRIHSISYLTDTIYVTTCAGDTKSIGTDYMGQTFKWQMHNGINFNDISDGIGFTGTTTAALSIKNMPTTYVNNLFRCLINGEPTVVYKLRFENKFIGTNFLERDWENPLYWSCGVVPDENTDVYLPTGRIKLSTVVTVKSITIDPGVIMTLASGAELHVKN